MLPADAALLLIDVQVGLADPRLGERNNPHAEERMAELLGAWRRTARPVVHVQHLSTHPGSPLRPELPGVEIDPRVRPRPGEPLFQKRVNSAFIGTGLEAHLRERGIGTLVVAGLTTDHCVSTTVRMAGNLGFHTYLVADATACHPKVAHDGTAYDAQLVHDTALASLHGEFAEVVESAAVLAMVDGTGAMPAAPGA